ncbi:IS110 family transposase [Breoghania sp. L-A4]|uniref:IS110 family transposase n=1 Tax=Breoghania sp. L-A4 TaxID=2304600 RepID=UPI000E35E001|nr:IS110 family transposase [Breoghania sp. L-A4]AXS38924.1 IS110 family transposase [Breoghania sp. L-A4]
MQGQIQPQTPSAQPVYVGIDVCKDHLDIHLHPLGHGLRLANDRDGVSRLKRLLARHDVARVVLEPTASYHRLVHRSLAQAGWPVAVVNPLRARLFAEVLGSRAKTDRVDAKMLAILGATLAPQATPPAPEALEDLRELVHARAAATQERTALANRLTASHVAVLKAELRRRLAGLDRHIARLAREIGRRITDDPGLARRQAILTSIPGIGATVAAVLIADMSELGQLDRHACASLAGVAPLANDSGDIRGPRHIRGGRAMPRRALYWAALSAARYNPDLAAFYKRLRDNAKKPKVALTAVMRKLIILANTLLKEDRLWTPKHA